MILALRLAFRDLRGGVRGLRLVLACLALGVAAIAAVGTLRTGIERALARDGQQILGGDIEIEGGSAAIARNGCARGCTQRGARLSDAW